MIIFGKSLLTATASVKIVKGTKNSDAHCNLARIYKNSDYIFVLFSNLSKLIVGLFFFCLF